MRAPVQTGEFPAPLKCGYISVGRVEQGPATLRGRDVFCPHPHQSRYLVPDDAVYPLTDGLPPERAVLAANPEPDTVSAETPLPVPPDNSPPFSRIMDAPLLRQRKPAAGRRVGAGRARWHIAAAGSDAELERLLSL